MQKLLITLALACLILSCSATNDQVAADRNVLSGVAEDLWGNRIDLSTYRSGVTVISPFSPST